MDAKSMLIMEQESEARETMDEAQTRLGLYYALKDAYSGTYLGREKVASTIITALNREQAHELVQDLSKFLDA